MRRGEKKRVLFSKFSRNKKGLSEIVANLLIILLVLVSVGVVWVVVRSVISGGAGDIELGQFTFDVSIESAYVSGTDVIVSVRRSVGGGSDLTGMNFTFLGAGDSITIKKTGFLQEGGRRTFTFTAAEIPGIAAGDEVSVAPTYLSNGEEKVTNPTDTKTISGTPPPGGGDGDGDGGGTGPPGTGFCGDGIIQNPNGDVPAITEQCDLSNLGGQTCIGLGFIGGSLACTSGCQFDTSSCTGAAPASCNGTWDGASEDAGVQCDGPLPNNGCSASCVCEDGFSQDFAGGCLLDPPLSTGLIYSIWPEGATKYFDSEDLPVDVSGYTGNYVNFTNSNENGCFIITFAEYLELNGRSYLRTNFVVNITVGDDGYSVWEAANCGQ